VTNRSSGSKPSAGAGTAYVGRGVGARTASGLELSPAWRQRLNAVEEEQRRQPPRRIVPRTPCHYRDGVRLVADARAAADMLDFARQRPLAFIGFDTEFRYGRPPVVLK
jgi:hypothetical protein